VTSRSTWVLAAPSVITSTTADAAVTRTATASSSAMRARSDEKDTRPIPWFGIRHPLKVTLG